MTAPSTAHTSTDTTTVLAFLALGGAAIMLALAGFAWYATATDPSDAPIF